MSILQEIKGLEAQPDVLGQSAGDLIDSSAYIFLAPLLHLGMSNSTEFMRHHDV